MGVNADFSSSAPDAEHAEAELAAVKEFVPTNLIQSEIESPASKSAPAAPPSSLVGSDEPSRVPGRNHGPSVVGSDEPSRAPGRNHGSRSPQPLARGVRLGIDVGKARIGVAASDPDGLLAIPVETVRRGPGDLARLVAIARERAAVVCYFGLPKHLTGAEGESAQDARQFAAAFAAESNGSKPKTRKQRQGAASAQSPQIEIRMIDERLTTVSATGQLREAGRKANTQRQIIDQQAAVIILQTALDSERLSTKRAGTLAP